MDDAELKPLFLSYGRADASEFADRLAHDLEHHTLSSHPRYKAFVDRVHLRAGGAWTTQLIAALRAVEGLVAVLSPHSVRTRSLAPEAADDSVCLDEISYARFAAKKPIVPLMLAPCEPPFEIFRLEYVDFTRWQDPQAYQQGLERLLDSLGAALRGELRYRRWNDRLQPWDFAGFLAAKRRGFTGRDRLFEEIRAFSEPNECAPALLVVGEPGIGKSAIVAELVHRNPDGRVIAYHCCQANAPETLRPGRFVRSLAAMIASRHPAYEAALEDPHYRDVLTQASCDADPRSAFDAGVLAALEQVGPPPGDSRRLLIVDALDEGLLHRADVSTTIVDLLTERIDRFPPWLAVVATTRDEPEVLASLAGIRPRVLHADDRENLRDLEAYARARLAQPPLDGMLVESGQTTDAVVATLAAAAHGNFLYAQQALDAVQNRVIELCQVGQLPPTLERQFAWFFERQFAADGWAPVAPVLETLVAAQEPIGESDLAPATGLETATQLPRALASLAPYLRATDDDPPRYEIFHRSLTEWLTARKRRGKPFHVLPATGHRRLADGLLARWRVDRLRPSPYALTHLATHLAAAAQVAEGNRRVELQEALAAFVLDPAVQQQRLEDPIGALASLDLALQTASAGPPTASAPIAFELALGLHAFRNERLNASRLFALARAGRLDAFEKELQLYPADEQWTAAARLLAAWLAREKNSAAANELRRGARTGTDLDDRIDALFESRTATFSTIDFGADQQQVADILRHIGGTDEEPVNPSMLWDQAAPPPPGQRPDAEGVRYLAEFHAPVFVAFAQQDRDLGTQRLHDYIALNAANAYRVYRNGSLWQILCAIARHRNLDWVREQAPPIVTAALAGGERDFTGALRLTLLTLRAAAEPACAASLNAEQERIAQAAGQLEPRRGRGDSWASYRRSLGAIAEARHLLLDQPVTRWFELGQALPPGYAGFQAPACLAFAETLAIVGAPQAGIDRALRDARVAAQNVQDLVFCTRTLSRVDALAVWWQDPPAAPVALADVVRRFTAGPRTAEFAARHVVGETYPDRHTVNPTSRLPAWLLDARTPRALALAYQWPLADFLALNPELEGPDTALADGTVVRVPDPRWSPLLASFLSSRVLLSPQFAPAERVGLILELVPRATSDRTALAPVLARLLLALRPTDAPLLDRLGRAFATWASDAIAHDGTAGPEPVA